MLHLSGYLVFRNRCLFFRVGLKNGIWFFSALPLFHVLLKKLFIECKSSLFWLLVSDTEHYNCCLPEPNNNFWISHLLMGHVFIWSTVHTICSFPISSVSFICDVEDLLELSLVSDGNIFCIWSYNVQTGFLYSCYLNKVHSFCYKCFISSNFCPSLIVFLVHLPQSFSHQSIFKAFISTYLWVTEQFFFYQNTVKVTELFLWISECHIHVANKIYDVIALVKLKLTLCE